MGYFFRTDPKNLKELLLRLNFVKTQASMVSWGITTMTWQHVQHRFIVSLQKKWWQCCLLAARSAPMTKQHLSKIYPNRSLKLLKNFKIYLLVLWAMDCRPLMFNLALFLMISPTLSVP